MSERPTIIHARAPVRICDCGGWTDTWFAGHGKVLNIAVAPYVEVSVTRTTRTDCPPVRWVVENFGDVYDYDPASPGWIRHPLLEAAVCLTGLPENTAVEIRLSSRVPSGAATGTSAAITVALIGALLKLNGRDIRAEEVASLAHRVETELLHRQSGIQDQLAAAYGGINWIEMQSYPSAQVHRVPVEREFAQELQQQLSLIYLGKGHDSSKIHEEVIQELENAGPDCSQLDALRQTAIQAYSAIRSADLRGLGKAMQENTSAQGNLHPHLISTDARWLIEKARGYQAFGWKVNGAGGDGGSITLLGPQDPDRMRLMRQTILNERPDFSLLPVNLDWNGLQVWDDDN